MGVKASPVDYNPRVTIFVEAAPAAETRAREEGAVRKMTHLCDMQPEVRSKYEVRREYRYILNLVGETQQ